MKEKLLAFFFLSCSLVSFAQYSYIENPLMYAENVENSHSSFYAVNKTSDLGKTFDKLSNYQLLNGLWSFQWASNTFEAPLDFHKNEYDASTWDLIPVPGDWQLYGYGYPIYTNVKYPFKADIPNVPREYNPVGSYRTSFDIKQIANTLELFLHFGGVNSAFFVWLNGNYVGYSQDSKLPAEFNVSEFIVEGTNNLAVQVFSYCDGTYLEDQDMWRVSGIERDVYLYSTPKQRINDVSAKTDLDSLYKNGQMYLDIEMTNHELFDREVRCKASLYDQEDNLIWDRLKYLILPADSSAELNFFAEIPEVDKWSAETPNLYKLQVVVEKDLEVIQATEQFIGFRKLEIVNQQFLVNGNAVLFKGVNRHEHDARFGHAVGLSEDAVTPQMIYDDLLQIKELNFNAVRTAHYPNHPAFYEICDQLGLYVIDEANIESHWYQFWVSKKVGNLDNYRNAILSRIKNMYERDKNHPSIVIWSIGNENGTGNNFVEAYEMLNELDGHRPVFNERHFFLNSLSEKHSDFNGHMYAPLSKAKSLVDEGEMPFIWIEYAHAMGNSSGNFKELWDFIREEPSAQGGFVWDWRDQGLWKTDPSSGEEFLAYGGDFEPEGVHNSGNFCANGVIASDGKLHPGAYEIAHVQSPIQIEFLNDELILIRNEFETRNLNEFDFIIEHIVNGKRVETSTLDIVDLSPYSKETWEISKTDTEYSYYDYFIEISVHDKNSDELVHAVQRIVNRVFTITEVNQFEEITFSSKPAKKKSLDTENDYINVQFSEDGYLEHYILDGDTVLVQGPRFNTWRAPTDNDYGNNMPKDAKFWKDAPARAKLIGFEQAQKDGFYHIHTSHKLNGRAGTFKMNYKIYPSGEIDISVYADIIATDIPKVGTYFILPNDFNDATYYGKGPHENYQDRNTASFVGYYSLDIDGQEHPYIRPQEYGNRCDVSEVVFSDGEKEIKISTNYGLNFSAWKHSQEDIDEGLEKQGLHPYEVPVRNYTWVNLDAAQRGLGGDDSWGKKPYDEYLLNSGIYSYTFRISPQF